MRGKLPGRSLALIQYVHQPPYSFHHVVPATRCLLHTLQGSLPSTFHPVSRFHSPLSADGIPLAVVHSPATGRHHQCAFANYQSSPAPSAPRLPPVPRSSASDRPPPGPGPARPGPGPARLVTCVIIFRSVHLRPVIAPERHRSGAASATDACYHSPVPGAAAGGADRTGQDRAGIDREGRQDRTGQAFTGRADRTGQGRYRQRGQT